MICKEVYRLSFRLGGIDCDEHKFLILLTIFIKSSKLTSLSKLAYTDDRNRFIFLTCASLLYLTV
jgi:hypothetical protein